MSTEKAILGHLKNFAQNKNEPISHAMIAKYLATVLDFKENTVPREKVKALRVECQRYLDISKPFTATNAYTNMQGRIQAIELILNFGID